MARLSSNIILCLLVLVSLRGHAQRKDSLEGPKPSVYRDYNDSSFKDFSKNRDDVAKAQINRLKGGALLVRLKTNQNTINKLKAAGNIDLATQVERETQQTNKAVMRAYVKEFSFCPVYFFYSQFSDSVKHQHLEGIFTDTMLQVNPSIVCHAGFYLVAEQNFVYNSSLGFVPLSQAPYAQERGSAVKEVAIVVKNRYFIQLHEPFPYYQKGYSIKKYAGFVKAFNDKLVKFYEANVGFTAPSEVRELVY